MSGVPFDDGNCFACGPSNPIGMHVHFERDAGADEVVARVVLALIAAQLERKEEAIAALREALRLRPRLSLEEIQLFAGRGVAVLAPL